MNKKFRSKNKVAANQKFAERHAKKRALAEQHEEHTLDMNVLISHKNLTIKCYKLTLVLQAKIKQLSWR